jgi:hypothetical protein
MSAMSEQLHAGGSGVKGSGDEGQDFSPAPNGVARMTAFWLAKIRQEIEAPLQARIAELETELLEAKQLAIRQALLLRKRS